MFTSKLLGIGASQRSILKIPLGATRWTTASFTKRLLSITNESAPIETSAPSLRFVSQRWELHGFCCGQHFGTFHRHLGGPNPLFLLDTERAAEPPSSVVRLRTVVIYEDGVVPTITKEGSAEFSNISRCFHPARRFRIEITDFLKFSILFFLKNLNANGSRHINSVIFWFMFFPRLQRSTVVANTSAAFRAFRRTIIKNVFACLFIVANNIRFTTGSFHFIQRPQLFSLPFQLCLYFPPFKTFMAIDVFLKTGF